MAAANDDQYQPSPIPKRYVMSDISSEKGVDGDVILYDSHAADGAFITAKEDGLVDLGTAM